MRQNTSTSFTERRRGSLHAQGVSFIARRDFTAGDHRASVAVGDFNGDGNLDLAVANEFSGNVSVLLGNGDGTFQTTANFGAGIFPKSFTGRIGVGLPFIDFIGRGATERDREGRA